MINLIKADFYKLFRSKGFYICTILSIAFALITLFSTNFTYNTIENLVNADTSPEAQESFSAFLETKPNMVNMLPDSFKGVFLFTFISIAISLFVASDFSTGVMKNIASKVSKREYIFLSKFIISIFITFVILLANFFTFLFGSLALWGPGKLPQNFYLELLRMCGLEFLAFIAMTSIFNIISFLLGKTGVAVAINICIVSLLDIVLSLASLIIDKVFKSDFPINDYWVFSYPHRLSHYALETDVIVRCSLVSIAYIAIITLLGVLLIKRKEIK